MKRMRIDLQRRSFVDGLQQTLPRATEIIRSQRIITTALNEHRQMKGIINNMALADKMKHLADRAKGVPASLEALADKHIARLNDLENRGNESFGKLGAVLDATESGIAAAEDALNQLTNGGGPL